MLDNPVGTACGFALDIGKARFFFTPGVPRELKRMLEEQIIPRLLAKSGQQTAIFLKRFHSYGLGESHVDSLLTGVDAIVPDGSVKLGFRAHYPQLETKLAVRGADMDDIRKKLEPVEREVRTRLGNFILGEDDQTLEGVILSELTSRQGSLSVVETFTSGQIAARLAHLPGAEKVFRRGTVARDLAEVCAAVGQDAAAVRARSRARRRRPWPVRLASRPARPTRWRCWSISMRARIGSISARRFPWRSRRGMTWPRGAVASSAAANGCGWARWSWGWIASAVTCRDCRSTSGSTSRRCEVATGDLDLLARIHFFRLQLSGG